MIKTQLTLALEETAFQRQCRMQKTSDILLFLGLEIFIPVLGSFALVLFCSDQFCKKTLVSILRIIHKVDSLGLPIGLEMYMNFATEQ